MSLDNRDRPVRVLCVFAVLNRGGAESMCMNLYRHIDRSKVQFDFVKHTSQKGQYEDEIVSLGGQIYEAPRFCLRNIISYFRWWKKHLSTHPEHQIIHGHYFGISSIYFCIAKSMGRITVGQVHASEPDSAIKALLCKGIKYVTDYRLACSKQAGKWVYGSKDFMVLNNGINVDDFRYKEEVRKKMRSALGIQKDFAIGTVANYLPVKNPMGMIDIFIHVKQQVPNARLIWIGDGELRVSIEERLREERIEDSVSLLGIRDDVKDVLQAMDAFLLPSFSEGLPVSVIEAQASGLPCYISNNVTREVDITGLCHFLPIDNPNQWADAIIHENNKRTDTSSLLQNAGYDIKQTSKWLNNLYLSMVNGNVQ